MAQRIRYTGMIWFTIKPRSTLQMDTGMEYAGSTEAVIEHSAVRQTAQNNFGGNSGVAKSGKEDMRPHRRIVEHEMPVTNPDRGRNNRASVRAKRCVRY